MKKLTFRNRDRQFYQVLNARVKAYFKETGRSPHANAQMVVKTVFFLGSLFGLYGALVWGQLPWYVNAVLSVALGLVLAGIGFNVMHDAAHGSYSRYPWLNNVLAFSLDLIGGSVALWKTKHNVVHHTYTNIPGMDGDVEQEAVIRLTPEQPHWPIHRYQHVYATFLYGLLSLTWVFFSDYEKLVKKRIANYELTPPTGVSLWTLFAFKILYVFTALVIPMLFNPVWGVLACYLLSQVVLSVVLTVVFQLAHVYDHAPYPMPNPDTHQIENEWAKHQIATTANFAVRNRLVNWYVGGLNFQVEHHLFPHICHVHYPKLNPIVVETCREFGVEYHEFPTLAGAIRSHYHQLYRLGHPELYPDTRPTAAPVSALPRLEAVPA